MNDSSRASNPRDASDLFDQYAAAYKQALSNTIAPSGKSREYFAAGRVAWLARCLREAKETPRRLLDFGCGDGAATPRIKYESIGEFQQAGHIDLAYCNGVFNHIPPAQRAEALSLVNGALRTGGLFSLWENNPWSLATRYVMSRRDQALAARGPCVVAQGRL